MIPIRGRTAFRVVLTVALTSAVGGCGLSEELDRELDPDRAVPSVSASPTGTDAPGERRVPEPPGGPESQPGAGSTEDTSAACPSSGVRMLPGLVESAMGLRAMSVTLTNCGTKPYTVNGYPSIQVLDENGERHDAVRVLEGSRHITTGVPDFGPHTVILKPGEAARTELVWRNTVTEADVPAVNAPYLRIAPLAGRPAEVLTPDGGIDLGNTGRLGTTAWAQVADGS
ncbi:DUF4232 domain-containing protein [Streptomyces sp. NBC_00481]|uniref:DUF4232 domain-containing protein n=1 Tax=unclassified Streptomyces TaxID=2593676 RepID=UPI002DD7EDF1|nr:MULTISPECIES: DUF4232 domain-containing protein [unclassified Streptomyces]WRY94633.1 DUF4232 domain-containing protein [Streptomyces sp. NBC_00481]